MGSIKSPDGGSQEQPKATEEHVHRMSEIEYENAKRDKDLADAKARAELAEVRSDEFDDLIQR